MVRPTCFKNIAALCTVLSTAVPGSEAFLPAVPRVRLLSQQRSISCGAAAMSINVDDSININTINSANTITNTNTNTEGGRASPGVFGQQPRQELVLREFSMPLQSSPGAYERRVLSECLEDGGEEATVVRWHISFADEQTGQARVEAVFLIGGGPSADNASIPSL